MGVPKDPFLPHVLQELLHLAWIPLRKHPTSPPPGVGGLFRGRLQSISMWHNGNADRNIFTPARLTLVPLRSRRCRLTSVVKCLRPRSVISSLSLRSRVCSCLNCPIVA